MKNNETLLRIFFYLVLVIVGILVGIALGHYSKLPIAEEINLMDIAALIVTIFLAVYVPAVLNQRLQTTRNKKDLLEGRVSDYQSLLRRINILVQDNRTRPFDDHLTIKNLLDISEHRLETLTSLIKNSGLDPSLNSDIVHIKNINNEHKNLLWNKIEVDTKSTPSEQSIREQEELLYNELDTATSLLIFKISNAK